MSGRRMLFIKPPKTSSTSVVHVLRNDRATEDWQVRGRASLACRDLAQLPPEVGLVHQHCSWHEVADWIEGHGALAPIMTFRDPLERTLSHYRYLRQRARRQQMPESQRPMCEEALARPLRDLVRDESCNFYGWTMPVQSIILGAPIDGRITEYPWPTEICDPRYQERALGVALERLERLWWIGITETLGRDIETLAFTQGWPPLKEARINVTRPQAHQDAAFCEADAATRRLLAERLAPDFILYESAREIAAERHRAMQAAGARARW